MYMYKIIMRYKMLQGNFIIIFIIHKISVSLKITRISEHNNRH